MGRFEIYTLQMVIQKNPPRHPDMAKQGLNLVATIRTRELKDIHLAVINHSQEGPGMAGMHRCRLLLLPPVWNVAVER